MSTNNYIQMMIDSLNKKRSILESIVELNIRQDEILSTEELDREAFDKNLTDKGDLIDEILKLDEGFQSLYNRVKSELEENKANYVSEIEVMKILISEVTELGAKIEVQESRNKVKVEDMFRRERRETSTAKRSASMAKSYYQSMNKLNFEPQFMDTKQ